MLLTICLSINFAGAQPADSVVNGIRNLPDKYYSKVDKKLNLIGENLSKKSAKYLAKFQKREKKIQEKLRSLNPERVISNADEKYKDLSQKIKSKSAKAEKIVGGNYNPYLDSLGTYLSFLKQFNGIAGKANEPLARLNILQEKLLQSEKIKEFIVERKTQLKEALSRFTKIPHGLKNEYDKLSKTAYYYSAQVKEYKDMLKDPKKIEQKALSLLNKVPAFQKFMKENGQLASLFRVPDNYGTAQNLAGLQTRKLSAIINTTTNRKRWPECTGTDSTKILLRHMGS